MDLTKHAEFFNPFEIEARLHIIGCGAVGSTLAENLVRLGCSNLYLYDFDKVEAHNIPNQVYRQIDIGKTKVSALAEQLRDINPDVEIKEHGKYEDQRLSGYVFLAVDNIELRHKIMVDNSNNKYIKAMFDFRLRLNDAQHYAASWSEEKHREALIASADFTEEEAKSATPMSACGTALTVIPTVRMIVAAGVGNFINLVKGRALKKVILIDAFEMDIISM